MSKLFLKRFGLPCFDVERTELALRQAPEVRTCAGVWISAWSRVCGIADYSKILFPEVKRVFEEASQTNETLLMISLDEFPTVRSLFLEIDRISPKFIHFQHEYGVFGGKNPPGYFFPRLIEMLRTFRPEIRLIATAHNVLDPEYQYPVQGRGIQVPARVLANSFLLPFLRPSWGRNTWGTLDATIVHSGIQKPWIEASGCRRIPIIPHFVFKKELRVTPRNTTGSAIQGGTQGGTKNTTKTVLVFGFFSPEKGQDIAIEALAKTISLLTISKPTASSVSPLRLVLAGGTRRPADEKYLERCRDRVKELGLESCVEFTGYVAAERMDALYCEADLVLAPFRETTGSGSLAHALARGASILCSDLELNLEINQREPEALSFFHTENSDDCARAIHRLLFDSTAEEQVKRHREAALAYAQKSSPTKIAEEHVMLYQQLVDDTLLKQTQIRWLQYSRYDLSHGLGGVEVHARSLQKEALSLGIKTEILRNPSDLKKSLATAGISSEVTVIHTHGSEPLWGEARHIVKDAKKKGVRIFRVHTFHGTTLGRMWACREFFWIGGYFAYIRELLGLWQADFLVGVNRLIHFRYFARLLRKPFVVLPNAWDAEGESEKALPEAVQAQLQKWKAENRSFFVFVGRGEDPVKNVEFLKSIWPVERSTIASGSTGRMNLVAVPGAGFSEDEAFHTGFLNPAQIRKLLVQSSGLLLTSHYEGYPLVALEALAQGVSVFSTHSGGADEIARFPVKGMYLLDREIEIWRSRLAASAHDTQDRLVSAKWNQSVLPRWASVMCTLLKRVDFSIASRWQS